MDTQLDVAAANMWRSACLSRSMRRLVPVVQIAAVIYSYAMRPTLEFQAR